MVVLAWTMSHLFQIDHRTTNFCWMVLDPTISVDGVVLWEEGVLEPQRSLTTHQCLLDWPELVPLFAKGNGAVGLPR